MEEKYRVKREIKGEGERMKGEDYVIRPLVTLLQ